MLNSRVWGSLLEWSIVCAMCCDSVVIMVCSCRAGERRDNAESEMEILYSSSGTREPQFTLIMITLRDRDSQGYETHIHTHAHTRTHMHTHTHTHTHSSTIASGVIKNILFTFYPWLFWSGEIRLSSILSLLAFCGPWWEKLCFSINATPQSFHLYQWQCITQF